jgi:hypothetical protein
MNFKAAAIDFIASLVIVPIFVILFASVAAFLSWPLILEFYIDINYWFMGYNVGQYLLGLVQLWWVFSIFVFMTLREMEEEDNNG